MIIEEIRTKKYKASSSEATSVDTFRRVARGIADTPEFEDEIFEELNSCRAMFGGRIMAFAGTGKKNVTLANCFVMGRPDDDMHSIMESVMDSAMTMKAGGGIGLNFSKLRPKGSAVGDTGSKTDGPVSFMDVYNSMSRTVDGKGQRKGAMIAVLNCDHPDIAEFIKAKDKNCKEHPVLEKFNISVGTYDSFMRAVEANGDWDLVFEGKKNTTVKAKDIFCSIVENNYKKAEPGVLFLDTVNRMNNLAYTGEYIDTCNPCGELPLPEWAVCTLGAINLVEFVTSPFTVQANFDFDLFKRTVRRMVRALDDVVDKNYYPLPIQREESLSKRRIGLGIMGLGSALAMLRVRYGAPDSLAWVKSIMECLRDTAYDASADLAAEKGAFPLYDGRYLDGEFTKRLPDWLRAKISEKGIRNSHLLTIAPTGTISQLVGFVSGGVEPIFDIEYERRNYGEAFSTADYSWRLYCKLFGEASQPPDYFVTAHSLTPDEHIAVQAECQYYVDSAISKTINVRQDITVDELMDVYMKAWKAGLKGCTIYRSGSLDEEILSKPTDGKNGSAPIKVHAKRERPYFLPGGVYDLEIPEKAHSLYVGFTHDENNKPMEMFFNTNDPLNEGWRKLVAMLTSVVFRSVDDPTFLIDVFKRVHGDDGFWSSRWHKWVPSVASAIGHVMEEDFAKIGLVEEKPPIEAYAEDVDIAKSNGNNGNGKKLAICPRCGQYSAKYEGGCLICTDPSCLYDKCSGQ